VWVLFEVWLCGVTSLSGKEDASFHDGLDACEAVDGNVDAHPRRWSSPTRFQTILRGTIN